MKLTSRRWLWLALAATLPACAARLKLPPSLDDATPLPVSGREAERFTSGELRFGAYAAFSINRGYSSSFADRAFFGNSIDQLRDYPQDDSYSFAFRSDQSGADEWRAVCTTAALQRGVADQAPKNQLACTCVNPTTQGAVAFEAASETDDLRGLLRMGDKSYAIAGSREASGETQQRKRATGYVLSEKQRALGAIDVLGDGTVWLVPGVQGAERDAVACAAFALLLHH